MKQNRLRETRNSSWVLMDYGDMIVHVFDEENRLFYDLERIWRDGKGTGYQSISGEIKSRNIPQNSVAVYLLFS